jgi:hypothetical protein
MQAEAPPAVVSLIAQGQANSLSESAIIGMDKQALLMLQAVIEKTLARISSPTREPTREPTQESMRRHSPTRLSPERETKPASPSSSPTVAQMVDELVDEVVDGPQIDGLEIETVASEKPDDGDTIAESIDEDVEMLL